MKNFRWRIYFLAFFAAWLSACATFSPGPKTVAISEAKLAELVARQFPLNSRYMDVFDVVLSTPQLRLLPGSNRIATNLTYTVGAAVLGARKVSGALNLSYGLRYEPSDRSVRLHQVRVEQFQVPGVPGPLQNQANRLGAVLAEQVLREFPLHHLKEEDLKTAQGWGYKPGAFRVVPGGLQLQLDPIEQR